MSLRLTPFAAAIFAAALALPAQTPAPNPQQPAHPTSTPYSGDLSIFEDPGRADRLHIDRVMDALKIAPGKTVGDIGAGGGWFTVRAAKRVGPSGKVIAEDINQHAVDTIHDRAVNEHFSNIVTLLGTPDDPKFAPDSLDAALMLRVYHEVAHPALLLAVVRNALRPGARFGIIDHNGHGDDHGINADVVRAEMESNGFRFVTMYDFVKADQNDYFLIFEKK